MYQRLENALSRLLEGEKPLKGTLGYTVDGVYTVSVPDNPAKYYVRFGDGTGGFAEVYHRGRAAPIPDLPVEVGFDSAGNMVILGGDLERAGLIPGENEVGPHSHARGSGMEYPIEPRLLTPAKASPLAGLTVGVAQGAYFYGTTLRWWGGGAIPVTPPANANQWAWVLVGIDPAAEALVTASGSAISITAPLDVSTLPAIPFAGYIPLAAVRLRNGQTELDEADFEDLRFVVGQRRGDSIVIRDEKAQNTHGGTFTSGAWQTRDLNVEAVDTGGHASLSANQITLAAGTYRLRASAPAFMVGSHQARWRNVSDGTTALVGTTEFADTGGTSSAQTRSVIVGRFSISASKTFALQHQCATTRSSDGFGAAANFGTEVYAEVELWRE
jgi:hypothetical protein